MNALLHHNFITDYLIIGQERAEIKEETMKKEKEKPPRLNESKTEKRSAPEVIKRAAGGESCLSAIWNGKDGKGTPTFKKKMKRKKIQNPRRWQRLIGHNLELSQTHHKSTILFIILRRQNHKIRCQIEDCSPCNFENQKCVSWACGVKT